MRERVGQLVDGTYRILREIGSGGVGVVFLARDEEYDRLVALKFLAEGRARDGHRRRLVREARALSALDHPNICPIHRIGTARRGQLYLCMPYLEGETLGEKLRRGTLPWSEAVDLAIQACAGLEAAHDLGIIHRDIKPGNLLVSPEGQLRIVDFGLAKRLDDDSTTTTGSSFGTLAYMSPEQACGESVDATTDLWSLGVVLFEMLAGRRPFEGRGLSDLMDHLVSGRHETVHHWRDDIPHDLAVLIDDLLEKNPRDRPQSARAVRARLEDIHETAEIDIFRDFGRWRGGGTWWRRRSVLRVLKTLSILVVAGLVAAIGALGLLRMME